MRQFSRGDRRVGKTLVVDKQMSGMEDERKDVFREGDINRSNKKPHIMETYTIALLYATNAQQRLL